MAHAEIERNPRRKQQKRGDHHLREIKSHLRDRSVDITPLQRPPMLASERFSGRRQPVTWVTLIPRGNVGAEMAQTILCVVCVRAYGFRCAVSVICLVSNLSRMSATSSRANVSGLNDISR